MTARLPLTPALVEQRLGELQQLSRLGASLVAAELPPIDRRRLGHRSLCVVGRAPGQGRDARDARFHVAPAAVDRQLGWMPDAWVDAASGRVVGTGLTLLVGASVNGQPLDALPRGRAGIVSVRFLDERPACVGAVPLLERSDGYVRLWLCLQRDRLHTQW